MFYRYITVAVLLFCCVQGFAASGAIDDFDYAAAWEAAKDTAPALVSKGGVWGERNVVVLPIRFDPDTDRNYWDKKVELDLSKTSNFSLHLFVEDATIISRFTLYFRSPDGWANGSVSIEESGWQTLRWTKGNFWQEDGAFDWKNVQAIRLSVWPEKAGDSLLALDCLSGYTPAMMIVKANDVKSDYYARRMAASMESILKGTGVSHSIVTDRDVEIGGLQDASLALFPYNVDMSTKEQDQIVEFVHNGGKVIHFYKLPTALADLLGFRDTGWTGEEYPGQFSACRFSSAAIKGLPEKMAQNSWNIHIFEPIAPDAKVIAYWEDSVGKLTAYPAWLASSTGAYMSHILLNEDKDATREVLVAMIGHYLPDIWQDAASRMLEQVGQIGEFDDYESLKGFIKSKSEDSMKKERLSDSLQAAERLRELAEERFFKGEFQESFGAAFEARKKLVDAYVLCQQPKPGEFRAVWEHNGVGVYPGDWEKSAVHLKEGGLGHIIPNMMTSGYAAYASDYLPRSKEFETYGDQIAACVEAAHRHGLKVHVWKVNFNLGSHVTEEWLEKMRKAKRTQVDIDGQPVNWLCPSNPENTAFEKNVMLEVVRKYDVDGIHFDYIRYPDEKSCYCDGCRERFEIQKSLKVAKWPSDCYGRGKLAQVYRDWRCEQITRLVAAVSKESRRLRSEIQISGAVFPRYPKCREQVGQDWVKWVEEGLLDFVCPMDYTESLTGFREMVSGQMELIGGRIPLHPGISVSSRNLPIDGLISQILLTRNLGADGFTIFQYDKSSDAFMLPRLSEGITATSKSADLELILPKAAKER